MRSRRNWAGGVDDVRAARLGAGLARWSLGILLLPLLVNFVLTGCRASERSRPRIGLVAGLSGPAAAYGMACRRGAELAIHDPHARGQNLELGLEHDQGRPDQTA